MDPLTIGTHSLNWGERTYVMGILNFTPDSFSGDGLLPSADPLAQAGLDALQLRLTYQEQEEVISQLRDALGVK